MLGILLILISTAVYNAAPIPLALAARSESSTARGRLVASVVTSRPGVLSIILNLAGWGFETAALTQISLTAARIFSAAGLILLLALAHWELGERLDRRELAGAVLVLVGIAAAGTSLPQAAELPPSPWRWLVMLLLVPIVVAPHALGRVRPRTGTPLLAVSAGTGYALASLLNKGLADLLTGGRLGPAVLSATALGAAALIAFASEIHGLRHGRAASVEPIIRALLTVIPIAFAPVVFGEQWPSDDLSKALLALGIAATVAGVVLLARSTSGVLAAGSTSPARGDS